MNSFLKGVVHIDESQTVKKEMNNVTSLIQEIKMITLTTATNKLMAIVNHNQFKCFVALFPHRFKSGFKFFG